MVYQLVKKFSLCGPEVHCRFHKIPPLKHVLRQMNPVHILIPNFSNIHFNIIFLSTPRSFK